MPDKLFLAGERALLKLRAEGDRARRYFSKAYIHNRNESDIVFCANYESLNEMKDKAKEVQSAAAYYCENGLRD